jgi:signal transduction histidine kinase
MQGPGEISVKLRRWPRTILADDHELARVCLQACCELFEAPRAILLIDFGDEPWLNIATMNQGEFTWLEDEDLSLESVVPEELVERSFFIEETIDPRLRKMIDKQTILSIGVPAQSLQARLFVCGPKLDPELALGAADMVSTLMTIQFEASAQLRNAVREAVEQDRTRVARDLHDGLLQSFTGVVLQLETVHSLLVTDPLNAQRMITETQGLIMSDQRELRRFVEELSPRRTTTATEFDFAQRLEELRSRFANQWKIHVIFNIADIDPHVSGFLGQETFRLISEAVTNSAKHGGATRVQVGLRTAGSEMHIEVSDNGTGFPFHGRLTLPEMRKSGRGPTMLAERISSLNGNITVDSTERGATVTMTVPLGFGG